VTTTETADQFTMLPNDRTLPTVLGEATSVPERCASYQVSVGRCQLVAGHDGVHAVDAGDASCLTWNRDGVQHWRMHPAPHWLIELDWVPGLQPSVHEPSLPTMRPTKAAVEAHQHVCTTQLTPARE
jgi:hypothetical protein